MIFCSADCFYLFLFLFLFFLTMLSPFRQREEEKTFDDLLRFCCFISPLFVLFSFFFPCFGCRGGIYGGEAPPLSAATSVSVVTSEPLRSLSEQHAVSVVTSEQYALLPTPCSLLWNLYFSLLFFLLLLLLLLLSYFYCWWCFWLISDDSLGGFLFSFFSFL